MCCEKYRDGKALNVQTDILSRRTAKLEICGSVYKEGMSTKEEIKESNKTINRLRYSWREPLLEQLNEEDCKEMYR